MAQRRAVSFLMGELGLSERRSCRIVGLSRSVQQYRPIERDDGAVVAHLRTLASENRRYGYLRLHALLRREGLVVNAKRTYRLYRGEDLQVRTKKPCPATAPGSDRATGAEPADAARRASC